MPEKETLARAQEDKREGKAPSTQAGEFVREEIEHVREGKHGARSTKQAIAIGLSKARRAGVKLKPPKKGSKKTRKQAARDLKKGRSKSTKKSAKRSRATSLAASASPRPVSPSDRQRHSRNQDHWRLTKVRGEASSGIFRTARIGTRLAV